MTPIGELTSQVIAMPKDTNPNGDIFGGWLFSQMDLAACTWACKIANGRAATVAVNNLTFIKPVSIGDLVSCYVHHTKTGKTSMTFEIEAWKNIHLPEQATKVTSSSFIFVAIDDENKPRTIEKGQNLIPPPLRIKMPFSPAKSCHSPYTLPSPINHNLLLRTTHFLGLCVSHITLIIGCMAITGLLSIPLAAAIPITGLGLAGIGFFSNAVPKNHTHSHISYERNYALY